MYQQQLKPLNFNELGGFFIPSTVKITQKDSNKRCPIRFPNFYLLFRDPNFGALAFEI